MEKFIAGENIKKAGLVCIKNGKIYNAKTPVLAQNNNRAEGSFGEYIKSLRLNKGLRLREVEQLTKISNPYISQLERGKREVPTLRILIKLAIAYGISSKELVEQARLFVVKNMIEDEVL